ncbi:hypothetical protein GCM10028857_19580 [Salinarchaeum chitinilyticum]
MGEQRILVMGDNHGDIESVQRVVDETAEETFDFAVHVGDLTNAYFDGVEAGVEQLQDLDELLQALESRTSGGLLYIFGNRDHARGLDGEYVYERCQLEAGTRIPPDGHVTVGGQRFTQSPDLVDSDDILVTHGERVWLLDHFSGRAYFSGHVHTGRYKGRCLNSAFLYRTDDHQAEPLVGGYFVVTVRDEPPFDVELRNLDRLQKIICPDHHERGVLFAADYHDCQFCYDNEHQFLREMASSAFYGLTQGRDREAVDQAAIVEYAVKLFENPPAGFEEKFTSYIENVGQHPKDPLRRTNDGRIVTPSAL